MKALVARLSDKQLAAMVNEYWSVAGILGHLAFWDGRALFLAGKVQRGEPLTPSDDEPGNVDWINDSSRPLIHAIAPRALAELAVSIGLAAGRGSRRPRRDEPAPPRARPPPRRAPRRDRSLKLRVIHTVV